MLKYLGVSRSGYRSWLNRTPSDTEKRREYIKAKIQDIYDGSKQNYGAPKITRKLRQKGETISERTVGKYMKEMGIKAQWVKPWTITTIDSDFSNELQNILDEQFTPDRPNAVWCSDITYIWTTDGFVYLTSIMDLFSRKIIAWTLSQTLEVSCVINTINKAKARRNTKLPLIIHSDRGSQYTSQLYRDVIRRYGIRQSMNSGSGRCHDNARCESMWARMKTELLYERYDTEKMAIDELKTIIWRYFISYWNNRRICSANGGLPPMLKRQQYYDSLKEAA